MTLPANSSTGSSSSPEPLLRNALDTLGKEIVTGTLAEGETFTLHDLSTRFTISRTVAREVMRALEQLGLVQSSRRVGIKVLPASEWDVFDQAVIDWRWSADAQRQLRELSELRFSVEPIAAALAARSVEHAEAAELTALADTMVRFAAEGDNEKFLAADIKFHTMILKASRNEMFHALAPSILHALEGRTVYGRKESIPSLDAVDAHVTLAQAIAARDPQQAEQASRAVMADICPCREP